MRIVPVQIILCALVGCAAEAESPTEQGVSEADLSAGPSVDDTLVTIKREALSQKIRNGWLIAGIAMVETNLLHCKPHVAYCAGPSSKDCGGGPVIAGGSDGPCREREGGLGLFQLDEGTHSDTLRAYKEKGIDVLTVAGNIRGAIDHLFENLNDGACAKGLDDRAEILQWLNGMTLGSGKYERYTGFLAHCYNGWDTGQPGWHKQKAKYDAGIREVLSAHPKEWWTKP